MRRLGAPFLLLLITIGFYWKLALTDQYTWLDHPDVASLEVPRLGFQAREIHQGRFPLWDPHLWAGQPLAGQTQPGPLYPLNLLLCLLPLREGYLRLEYLNWYYVLVHFQAALFCYWLARDLGRSRGASMVAGCVFSLGGFLGTVPWPDVLNSAMWTPLVALFLLRAVRGDRPAASAALGGLALGAAWLCGHHEIPMLVSWVAVSSWLFYAAQRGRRVLLAGAVFLVTAGLTSAVQTWPTWEFARVSHRWIGQGYGPIGWKDTVPYGVHTVYSLPARGLLEMVLPRATIYADASPFLGVAAVSLAALGLAMKWKDAGARWLAAVGGGGAVYSLGVLTPLHGVLYSVVPMLQAARVPVRAFHLVNFAVAALAAYGIDSLLGESKGRAGRRLSAALAAYGVLILAAQAVAVTAGRVDLDDRILLSGLAALALAVVTAAPQRATVTVAVIVGLALVELNNIGPAGLASRFDQTRNQHANALYHDRDIADFLRSQPGPLRVAVNDQDVPVNFGDWHGIDMLQGYVAGVSNNVLLHELHTRRSQMLLGVTHSIGRKPEHPDQETVFRGSRGIQVFRNPDALPRVWTVHRAVAAASEDQLRIWIQDPSFDLRRNAILLGNPPALETCADEDEVRIDTRESDRVRLAARMSCRGMVVLSETMFAGWQATVDGRPARVHEAYGTFRAVVVEAGSHTIEMRYRPVSVYGGATLTVLGILLAAALAWWARYNEGDGAAGAALPRDVAEGRQS